jgi:hypothetical protein
MLFGIISLQCPDPKFISALQAGSINIGSEDSILKRATANSNANFILSIIETIEINNPFYKVLHKRLFIVWIHQNIMHIPAGNLHLQTIYFPIAQTDQL